MFRRVSAFVGSAISIFLASILTSCGHDTPASPTVDTTPPAAVGDLAAASPSPASVTLTWTAPGDDGDAGNAAAYAIRYSASTISEATWGSAVEVQDTPRPKVAGSQETLVVTGLEPQTTYNFALKTRDEVPNQWSALSSVATETTTREAPVDSIRPAPVTDLTTFWAAATGARRSVELRWTAVGDDSLDGVAAAYDIRYSTVPITPLNWSHATPVPGSNVSSPTSAGGRGHCYVDNLAEGTIYYFALRTRDEVVGRWSALSNAASDTTDPRGTWSGLSPAGISEVSSLCVYNGVLYAASDGQLYQRSGSTWTAVPDPPGGKVYDYPMITYNGGPLTTGPGGLMNWNGQAWSSILGDWYGGAVYCLMSMDNGALVMGGDFSSVLDGTRWITAPRIAILHGGTWGTLGAGFNGGVNALTVYQGALVAAGDFTTADGSAAAHIARWNGQRWESLGAGLNGSVRAITVFKNELVACGKFTASGMVPVRNIARWNGSRWTSLSYGIGRDVDPPNFYPTCMMVFGGELIVGGWFYYVDVASTGWGVPQEGILSPHIARWDGARWKGFGVGIGHYGRDIEENRLPDDYDSAVVDAMCEWNGALIVAGWLASAGQVETRAVAAWQWGW
jgi:hypothetical protein